MKKAISVICVICYYTFLSYGEAYAKRVAIIVNKDNKVSTITKKELLKIFKGYRKRWSSEKEISLILLPVDSPESAIMLKKIYHMRPMELKKFWLTSIFKKKIHSFPKTLNSNEILKMFVSKTPTAIGYIDARFADESVKVLSVDGKTPEEDGYLLTD